MIGDLEKLIAVCVIGSTPFFSDATAMPASECVWITQ